jgi:hypothetical protein
MGYVLHHAISNCVLEVSMIAFLYLGRWLYLGCFIIHYSSFLSLGGLMWWSRNTSLCLFNTLYKMLV